MKNTFISLMLLLSTPLFSQFGSEQILALDHGAAYEAKVADLDGDGDPDVVAGLETGLVWYENLDGLGAFSDSKIINGNPFSFVSIQLVDLDLDSDLDVLAASSTDRNFSWYENDGNGYFSQHSIFTANNAAFAVFAVDLDMDGDMDVLTGHAQNTPVLSSMAYFKNNGSMTFTGPTNIDTDNTIDGITAADYDEDGDVDVAAVFKLSNKIIFYENNGSLSFSQAILSSTLTGASSIVTADMDGDADLDLLVGARNNGAVGVYKNLGNNNFQWELMGSYFQTEAVFPADLDGDDDLDVLAAGDNGNQTGWWENDGNGSFSFVANISVNTLGAVGIHAADLDGDGDQDVISASQDDGKVVWHVNAGGANFGEEKLISTSAASPAFVNLKDIEGDGDLDVVALGSADGLLSWFPSQGDGTLGRQQSLFNGNWTSAKNFAFGDLDGDGDEDIVISSAPQVTVLINLGGGNFSDMPANPDLLATAGIVLSDLNGDGNLDIAGLTGTFGEFLVWYKNTGSVEFGPAQFLTELLITGTVKATDFDADGDLDLLVAAGKISFFENNGDGTFAPEQTLVEDYYHGMEIADMDYDGDLDIVASNANEIAWFENLDGQGALSGANTMAELSVIVPANLFVADLDGNGWLDVLSGSNSNTQGGIYWVSQISQDSFSPFKALLPIYASSYLGAVPAAGDFDQDGDQDVFASWFATLPGITGKYIWYENFANDASISGKVFWDENENGTFDAGDTPLNHLPVNIEPAAIATFSGANGQFNFYVNEPGDYTVSPTLDSCWTLTTSPASYTVAFDGMTHLTGLDFGVKLNEGPQNLQIALISAPTRCGFTVPFWLSVTNDGCTVSNGRYSLVLSDLAAFMDAVPAPDEVAGDTLFWDFENLYPGQEELVKLHFTIADFSFSGQFVQMKAEVFFEDNQNVLTPGDLFQYYSVITCAYDPNDKLVYPQRGPENGFTQNYTLFDETLLYTIRFQNTGNDTAFNVVIRDHLSPDLDWETFEPGSASHPYEATLHEDGLAEFHFHHILLPDSTTNEPGSHGFVSFRIRAKEGLDENTVVGNSAGIYFDFNPPILTDTVESVMVSAFPTPVASFSWTADALNYTFTDKSLNAPDAWFWDFGDGSTGTEQNPAHTFTEAGIYTVCLIATNSLGSDTVCQQLEIILAPVAAFVFSANELEVTFTDNSSNNPNTWNWDFGDGVNSTEQNPVHSYTDPGTYEVCLSAANPAGEDTFCDSVQVILDGVGETTWDNQIYIMPNPVSDRLTLVFEKMPLEETSVRIRNLLGQQMGISNTISTRQHAIEAGHLSEGFYLLEVIEDGSLVAGLKFLVVR